MKVEIINPIDYPNWDDLLLTNPDSTFFQTSAWARVLHETYNYKPLYFTSTDAGDLCALISVMEVCSALTGKRGVALPFTDFCPVVSKDDQQVYRFIQDLIQYGRESDWKYFELRGGCNFLAPAQAAATLLSHSLDLSKGEQAIFNAFRGSNQRNIRRAVKANVQVQFSNTWEALQEFYHQNCITRKRHHLPPQPVAFFKKIYDHIISQSKGFVALARHQNVPIAGAVFFHFGNKVIFKYGASLQKYHHLRPNNLLLWEAIKKYLEAGYRYFSFGKTSFYHQGLLQFKRGWGARERTIYYYRYDLSRNAYVNPNDRLKFFYPVFGALPVPLLKAIGKVLYRHFA